MGKVIAIVVVLAAILGIARYMLMRDTTPPPVEISGERAIEIADMAKDEFCRSQSLPCPDFAAQGKSKPVDGRFQWAFRYVDFKTDPAVQILVSVGKLGEKSVAFSPLEATGGATK